MVPEYNREWFENLYYKKTYQPASFCFFSPN